MVLIAVLCMVLATSMLAACGGSSGSNSGSGAPEQEETAEPEEEPTEEADPSEKFIGSWKLAAAKSQGVVMSGDFSKLLEMDDEGMLTIDEGGTGKMKMGDEAADITWKMNGDNAITIDSEKAEKPIDIAYEDDTLLMTIEEDDQEATAIFTHDGAYAEARTISMDGAEDITSEDELIGSWDMTGMAIMGISIYGETEDLTKMSGGEDMSVTFEKGGVAKMMDSECSWTVGSDGAEFSFGGVSDEYSCPIKKLGEDIIIDMSKIMGEGEIIILLSKGTV